MGSVGRGDDRGRCPAGRSEVHAGAARRSVATPVGEGRSGLKLAAQIVAVEARVTESRGERAAL